ncbi:MAG: PEP-CTERM sorting domain-containing protein [Pirellulaceae bacterium]|nr:PEP-CTERM sorting domain-containing protein [Pirellulaceae bacterium]
MKSSTLLSILLACGFGLLLTAAPATAEVINVDTGEILFYDNFESQPAGNVSHAAYPDVLNAVPTGSGIIGGGSYYFSQMTGGSPVLTNIQVTDYVSGTDYPAAPEGDNCLRLSRYDGGSTEVRQLFAADQAVGTHIHVAEMVYISYAQNYIGGLGLFNKAGDARVLTMTAVVSGNRIQYYDGAFKYVTGLNWTLNKWQKWEIDYVVGSGTCTLSIDGTSVSGDFLFSDSALPGSLSLSGGSTDRTPTYFDEVRTIPEPSTLALLACGLVGLLAYAWRKRK